MAVTQGGQVYPFDLGAGVGYSDALTQPGMFATFGQDGSAVADPASGISAGAAPKVSTLWYFFGVVLLLVAFKFSVEHEKSGMDFHFLGIGVYNFVAAGTMALLFIILIKTILNKYRVPGLTDLVNAA